MTRCLILLFVLCSGSVTTQGAENEPLLLTFDGDLIGLIRPGGNEITDPQQAARIIRDYHQLLPDSAKTEAATLHGQILRFIPGFEVAYTAADSAEIAHVMSEIDLRLAALQKIHVQEYTQDVVDLLTESYQLILPAFGDQP